MTRLVAWATMVGCCLIFWGYVGAAAVSAVTR